LNDNKELKISRELQDLCLALLKDQFLALWKESVFNFKNIFNYYFSIQSEQSRHWLILLKQQLNLQRH
jgi:hypothetical protein